MVKRRHASSKGKILFGLGLMLLGFAGGCSGSKTGPDDPRIDPSKEKLIDALTLFVEAAQSDHYDKALGYLTLEEKQKMTESTGQIPPTIQRQLKALRLSTLASKPGVRLVHGKLEGIFANLPMIYSSPGPQSTRNLDVPLLPQ